MLGSPAYLAPEAFETSRLGPSADIFALGIVAYELCLGRKPFEADSIPRYAWLVRSANPVEPRKLRPDFPTHLQNIIGRMLKKNAADRYLSASDIVAELDRFIENARAKVSVGPGKESDRTGDWD